jgi:hypothetical protein
MAESMTNVLNSFFACLLLTSVAVAHPQHATTKTESTNDAEIAATKTQQQANPENPDDAHAAGQEHEFRGQQVAVIRKARPPQTVVSSLPLTSPLDYQVIQRTTRDQGTLRIAGTWQSEQTKKPTIRARLTVNDQNATWQTIDADFTDDTFTANIMAPAGGWHQLDVLKS